MWIPTLEFKAKQNEQCKPLLSFNMVCQNGKIVG